jgi:epoxyqueuosine reductase
VTASPEATITDSLVLRDLASRGLNVVGRLGIEDYNDRVPVAWQSDPLHPQAESALIIGSGGDAFYHAAMSQRPEAVHPIDEQCEALVVAACDQLNRGGADAKAFFYWERRGGDTPGDGEFADFVALGKAAGLGASSRLGLLLHREFGPWFAIRALILTNRVYPEPTARPAAYDPCRGCDAPCEKSCPGKAIAATGFDVIRCQQTRQTADGCATRCDARLACPEGSRHRYGAAALSHHMCAAFRSDR